ncbi:CRISPR-associated helicase/endonuclease Cas3 [Streptomyces mayteni]
MRAECKGGRVGVPHKDAGMLLAAERLGLACGGVVFGHHGGLLDWERLRDELDEALDGASSRGRAAAEAIGIMRKVIPEIVPSKPLNVPSWLARPARRRGSDVRPDLLLRMLFSCLVDADYLDTEAHFLDEEPRLGPVPDMAALVERFEQRRLEELAKREPSAMDAARRSLYKQSVAAAAGERGMYVLHGPTGSGKTLAMAGFALHHAARHALKRVIVAVPFISVTEQNAQVYRRMLEPDEGGGDASSVVLEHHSEADLDDESAPWARLAAENWDAPFVVTTTVQLFQSLFSRKPAAMRKLHRLAGAVIVLDEVQSLPDHLLAPILSGLRGLVEDFGATVVLASATQPEFWSLAQLDGLPARRIVEDPATLFEQSRRVTYEWLRGPEVTWERVADEATTSRQALTVVNTTRSAAALHQLLETRAAGAVLHLSTRMTAGHRRATIARIRELLDENEPLQVASTSLVEAGVDLSFPLALREENLPESMQQAAGRCNREGLPQKGRVVLFRIHEEQQRARRGRGPAAITLEAGLAAARSYFGPEEGQRDPDDLQALAAYYVERYAQQLADGSGMGSEIDEQRVRLNFESVAAAFQMIDDTLGVPVIAVHEEKHRVEVEAAVAVLRSGFGSLRETLRMLQPYIARLPRWEAEAARRVGLAEPVLGDGLLLWCGSYHPLRGIDPIEKENRSEFTV